jgi:hypothetical protein
MGNGKIGTSGHRVIGSSGHRKPKAAFATVKGKTYHADIEARRRTRIYRGFTLINADEKPEKIGTSGNRDIWSSENRGIGKSERQKYIAGKHSYSLRGGWKFG